MTFSADSISLPKKPGCPFCELAKAEYILENKFAFVKLDIRPVTEGHSLIIPKRHFADYFDASEAEKSAMNELLQIRRDNLLTSDTTIEGFNIGINCGKAAGQTVLHCHIHLIPRRKSDGENPKAEILKDGIRGVIQRKMSCQNKGNYL